MVFRRETMRYGAGGTIAGLLWSLLALTPCKAAEPGASGSPAQASTPSAEQRILWQFETGG